jgi:hypothetical protein
MYNHNFLIVESKNHNIDINKMPIFSSNLIGNSWNGFIFPVTTTKSIKWEISDALHMNTHYISILLFCMIDSLVFACYKVEQSRKMPVNKSVIQNMEFSPVGNMILTEIVRLPWNWIEISRKLASVLSENLKDDLTVQKLLEIPVWNAIFLMMGEVYESPDDDGLKLQKLCNILGVE